MSETGAFVRHFAEVLGAMLLGMAVLGAPFHAAGAPAVASLGMATAMTLPMVAWMRHRGHSWTRAAEMAAAMFGPALALLGLVAAGVLEGEALLLIQHAAMVPSMLAAMVLRREDYSAVGESRWSCPVCTRASRA